MRLVVRHRFDDDQVATGLGLGVYRLFHRRHIGVHDHVGQHDGKRLVADNVTRTPNSVAQAIRLHLTDEAHLTRLGQFLQQFVENGGLALRRQLRFEFELMIEIVFDRTLVAAGDENEMLDPGGTALSYHV